MRKKNSNLDSLHKLCLRNCSFFVAFIVLCIICSGCNAVLWQSSKDDSLQSSGLNQPNKSKADNNSSTAISQSKLTSLFTGLNYNNYDFSEHVIVKSELIFLANKPYLLQLNSKRELLLCRMPGSSCSVINSDFEVLDFTFHSQSKQIAIYDRKLGLFVYDLDRSKIVSNINRIKEAVSALTFSEEGDSLLVGTLPGKIYNWYFKDSKNAFADLSRYSGHASIVKEILTHPSNRLFFSYDIQGRLSAWQIFEAIKEQYASGQNIFNPNFWSDETRRIKKQIPEDLNDITVSNDGKYLFLAKKNGKLDVWSVRGFIKRCELKLPIDKIKFLEMDSKTNALLAYNSIKQVKVAPYGNWDFTADEPETCSMSKKVEAFNYDVQRAYLHNGQVFTVTPDGVRRL